MALSNKSDEDSLIPQEGGGTNELPTAEVNGLNNHTRDLENRNGNPSNLDQRTYFDERIEIPGLFEFFEALVVI